MAVCVVAGCPLSFERATPPSRPDRRQSTAEAVSAQLPGPAAVVFPVNPKLFNIRISQVVIPPKMKVYRCTPENSASPGKASRSAGLRALLARCDQQQQGYSVYDVCSWLPAAAAPLRRRRRRRRRPRGRAPAINAGLCEQYAPACWMAKSPELTGHPRR